MPTSIYTLADPYSGEIRYVGKTTQKPSVRHKSHWVQARWAKKLPQTHVARWIRTLPERPRMEVLCVVDNAIGAAAEKFAIAVYRSLKCRLTNLTAGGDGMFGFKLSPEQRQKRIGRRHRGQFLKGHQMTPEDRLAQRAMMKGNQWAKLGKHTPERKAKRAAGVWRFFAKRRNGFLEGDNWEAYTPNKEDRRRFLREERAGAVRHILAAKDLH